MGSDFSFQNIMFLVWIAIGIGIIVIIIIFVTKFLKKDNEYSLIEKNLKAGNYKKALTVSMKYLTVNPNDYLIKYYIAQAYEGMKDYNNAIQYYEKSSIAASTAGQSAVVTQMQLKTAKLFRKMTKPKEALGYYVMVLDKNPKHTKALYEAAEILTGMKNYKKAKEYLQILEKLKPDNLRAKFLLARVYAQLNELANASKNLEELIKRLPAEDKMASSAAMLLADVYINLKKHDDAICVLKKLLNDREYFESVLIKIINVYIRGNKFKEAIDMANRNIGRVSKSKKAQILYQIASAYFKYGEVYKALKIWEEASQLSPNFMDLKDILIKYKIILKNSVLENFYTRNNTNFQMFCEKMIKVEFISNVIKKDSFWIFVTKDAAHIVYKLPFPMSTHDLDEVERHLRNEIMGNMQVFVYSLFGLADNCKGHYIYRKLNEISSENFVEQISKVNS